MPKEIRLEWIALSDWRGQTFRISFKEDGITEIRGKNGIGKSSIVNAYNWLLHGFDMEGRSNFDLFNTLVESHPDMPEAVVEAGFKVDGVETTLKRTAKSAWIRKRGKAEYEKASADTYKYFVDKVEVTSGVYQERILAMFGIPDVSVLKMITNPNQYNTLEWRELRNMFQRIIGEIKESDFKGDYSLVEEIIARHGLSTAKKSCQNEVTELKNNEKQIERDIKALESAIPEEKNIAEAQQEIEKKQERISEIDKAILGLGEANKPLVEKRKAEEEEILALEREMNEKRRQHSIASCSPIDDLRKQLAEINSYNNRVAQSNREKEIRKSSIIRLSESNKRTIDELEEEVKILREQSAAVRSREFSEICPTCGQPRVYDEKLAEEKAKFYEMRDKERESIRVRGEAKKEQIARLEHNNEELRSELLSITMEEPKDANQLQEAIAKAQSSVIPFELTEEYKTAQEKIESKKAALTEIPQTDSTDFILEKQQLLAEIKSLSEITALATIRERLLNEIHSKRESLSATGIALAKAEQRLFKIQEYEREKASIISVRVNKYLTVCNVKMLALNKSGEYVDTCVVTVKGVGESRNQASGVLASVDICNAFQRYYEIAAPVFVDACEAVVSEPIPCTEGQQIRLYADASYPTLTVI